MTLRLKIERSALFLFVGGISYGLLELFWRGRTHWTMLLLGGVCFLCIGAIRRKGFSLPLRSLLCALIVTALEFLTGCVVNLRLHWAVWDYSANHFQLLGQVCALYSFLWLLLSLPACALASGGTLTVSPQTWQLDLPVCLGVILLAMVIPAVKKSFYRWQGEVLVAVYAAYLVVLVTMI